MTDDRRVFRVFPWIRSAVPGEPFSPEFLPPSRRAGRFDFDTDTPILYTAAREVHAVAEALQGGRDRLQDEDFVHRSGDGRTARLSLVTFDCPAGTILDATTAADLCGCGDGFKVSHLAASARPTSQAAGAVLHDLRDDIVGFRWWSRFRGEWEAVVLFLDRCVMPGRAVEPAPLDLDHPAVQEYARTFNVGALIGSDGAHHPVD